MAIELPSIIQNMKAPVGTNPQDAQSVSDQMAMQFAPQESSINTTIKTIEGYLGRDIATQQQYGNVADQKIATIGTELAQKLQGNVGAIGDIYDKGTAKVGGFYDQAGEALKGLGSSVQDPIKQGMANLGIKEDPYSVNPLSRLQASMTTMQGRNVTGKADSQANLSTLGTALKGIAQKTVGDSEREYAQKRTDVATQVLKVIGQLQSTANEGIMGQLQKFSDLASAAGPTFRTLLTAATSARTTAEQKAANDAFEQALKIGKFNQDQQAIDQKNDPNSLDNQLKGINVAKGMKSLDGSEDVNYISESDGMSNLQSFLDQSRGLPEGQRISGTSAAGIQNWINENLGSSKMSGIYNTADAGQILSSLAQTQSKKGVVELPFTEGTKYKNRANGDYMVDLPTLLAAIQTRFQNVGPSSKTGTKI